MPQLGKTQYLKRNINGNEVYQTLPYGGNVPYGYETLSSQQYIQGLQNKTSEANKFLSTYSKRGNLYYDQAGNPFGGGATYSPEDVAGFQSQIKEVQAGQGVNAPDYTDPSFAKFQPNAPTPSEQYFTEAEKARVAGIPSNLGGTGAPTTLPITSSGGKSPEALVGAIQNNQPKASDDPTNQYNTATGKRNPNFIGNEFNIDTGKRNPFFQGNQFNIDTGAKNQYYNPSVSQGTPAGTTPTPTPPVATSGTARAETRAAEIAKIKAELEAGTTKPASFDTLAKLDALRVSEGVVKNNEELNTIQDAMRQAKEELNQFKQTSGKELSQSGYLGGISEVERNMNFRLSSLALREQAVIGRINVSNAYINQAMSAGQQTYTNAKQAYDDEYNKNVKSVELYNKELDDQQKDALTGVTTLGNLIDKGNMTAISPQISSSLDTYALQLGLPSGSFQELFKSIGSQNAIQSIKTDNGSVYAVTTDKTTGVPTGIKVLGSLPKSVDNKPLSVLDVQRYNESYPNASVTAGDTETTANQKVQKSNTPEAKLKTIIQGFKDSGEKYEKVVKDIDSSTTITDKAMAKKILGEVYGKTTQPTGPVNLGPGSNPIVGNKPKMIDSITNYLFK